MFTTKKFRPIVPQTTFNGHQQCYHSRDRFCIRLPLNYIPVFCRFRDITTHYWKITKLLYPTWIHRDLSNFMHKLRRRFYAFSCFFQYFRLQNLPKHAVLRLKIPKTVWRRAQFPRPILCGKENIPSPPSSCLGASIFSPFSFNLGIVIGTYAVLKAVISNDPEWP